MRVSYFQLFRVRLRHRFYRSGRSEGDFTVAPSVSTARVLHEHGLRFLPQRDGFSVYAEIDPATRPKTDNDQPKLRLLDGDEVLRMQFHLHAANRYLINFTDLPGHRPGGQVFYFNNLRHQREDDDGGLQLMDSVAGVRFGAPLELVTSTEYAYRFKNPVHSGTLTITDLFDRDVLKKRFEHPTDVDPAFDERLDFSSFEDMLPGRDMVPGRYRVTDDLGESRRIFYAPDVFGELPFGVVEIFTSTLGLADPPTNPADLVPAQYRVFQDGKIRRVDDFNIQFEPLKTIWRYNVAKKYEVPAPGIDVGSLKIDDGVFDRDLDAAIKPMWAKFSSKLPRALTETPAGFELKHNNDKRIRKLPNPLPEAPLKIEGTEANPLKVSDLFIYI